MNINNTVYDYFERFGLTGAINEAGKMMESATTIEQEEFYGAVVDHLLDLEEANG